MDAKVCRIAVFYDGTYFNKVSNYYAYHHERQARLSVKGLHAFITAEVAKAEQVEPRRCQIVDAAYFRGRLTAQQALEQDKLYTERLFEDVLMRADVTLYQQHVAVRPDGTFEEKSIDVWLALQAYEMASFKRYDVCVLLTGDGDFVPLVRKLGGLGCRVMLLGWDFAYEHEGKLRRTRVSTTLIEHAHHALQMNELIDDPARADDPALNALFLPKAAEAELRPAVAAPTAPGEATEMPERQGQVANVAIDKGYGFITPAEGGENVFFHRSDLRGVTLAELAPRAAVRFLTVRTERGWVAREVHLATNDAS